MLHSRAKGKCIGIGNGVTGLQFGGTIDQVIGAGDDGKPHAVDMGEHFQLLLSAESTLGNVDKLADVDRVDQAGDIFFQCLSDEVSYLLSTRLILKETEQRKAVEEKLYPPAKSPRRSFSNSSAREGVDGSAP